MATHAYLAILQEEGDGRFSITFPDVPSAISEGDNLEDALANGKEALESILDSLIADGLQVPAARETHEVLTQARGAIVAVIEAETETKATRVNVTFDERLLARIDRAAEQSGQTRSGFLARAAREHMFAVRTRDVHVGTKLSNFAHHQDTSRHVVVANGERKIGAVIKHVWRAELERSRPTEESCCPSRALRSFGLFGSGEKVEGTRFRIDRILHWASAEENSPFFCWRDGRTSEPTTASKEARQPS